MFGNTARDEDAGRLKDIAHPNKEGCGIQFILYEIPRRDNEFLIDWLTS